MGKPNAKIPLILSLILILLTCSANGQKQSSPNKITDFYFLKPLHGFTYENVDFNDKGCELSKESATGLIITSKVKVPWRKVSPFLAFSCGAFVENYTMDNFKIYVRTYSNREKWSNWAELKMGSEIELSPTTFTSELQYYNPHTTYIQIKIELSGNANSKILIKQLSLNFINPSVKLGQIEESNKISEPNSTNSVCPCPMPAYSTRSSWGAPSGPTCSPNPSSTVSHLIIHHQGQSGSISAPYANDVYSIYVYHTSPQPSGNGWCDIGYNWLIDPNGQLYEGRGGSISNNIIGAHFSCMNTGTMGVCLLNNFDTFSPQPNAISKLEELLAWKCCDVGIPPIGTAFHSASGLTLNRISGHSNGNSSALGCPTGTSCPGTNLYSLLPTIRNAVNTIINSCNGGGCSQPTNDGCSGSFSAIPLTFGTSCNPTSATSCGATSSGFASCVGNQDDDVFFSFSPTSTSATISIVSSTGYDAVFQVLSGSCGGSMTQLVCIDNTGTGNTETTTINVAIGSTYFIRVWDYFSGSGTSGNFTICVYGSGGCTPPGTPTLTFGSNSCPGSAGNNISPPGTPLTWNTVSGANGYKIYVSKYPYGSSCLLSGYNPFPCSNYSGQIVMSAALDPGMLYRWNVYATSDCSNSSCDSPISTTKYFYTPPTISPSTSQTICQGNSVLFSTTAANVCSGNPVTYQWYRNSAPISGATNTTYSATLSGTYYVEFNFSGSSSCSSASIQSSSVNITVNPIPSCSNITGVTTVCQGSTQSYSASCSNATSYNWSVPIGWTITSGQGTSSINVTVGANSGQVCVTPSNSCGNGTQTCVSVTVSSTPSCSNITGVTTVCQGSTQSYSASCSNATSYNWSVPIGWTITSGQGTSSINVTVGANSGQVCVTPSNSCGNGTQTCVSVTVSITPSCSGGMSGLVSVCEFSSQNYSVSCVDANSYNWTIPSGWTINSGQGTSSLNVSTGSNSGQVCVTPSNNCGNGAQICLSVISETTPSQPSTIVGDTIVCQFDTVTYLVNAVPGATSYNWGITVGTFLSGTNTDSIIVICSNIGIGTIQSVAINNCGTSATQTLNVNVIPAGSCGTGINQSTNEPSFSIFPNPTDEAIHITGNNLSGNNYTYSLYNTIGQLLQYENLLKSNNEIETEINLAAFPSGVYLLQISSEGYSNSLKIFKK